MNARALKDRKDRLMPGGVPRWVRCYDNGGDPDKGGSTDRYTVLYVGRAATERAEGHAPAYPLVSMSSSPFSPQGVGLHGSIPSQPSDTIRPGRPGWHWPPAVGRRHPFLGMRIRFEDLPDDCRTLVRQDYEEIWRLREEDWTKGSTA